MCAALQLSAQSAKPLLGIEFELSPPLPEDPGGGLATIIRYFETERLGSESMRESIREQVLDQAPDLHRDNWELLPLALRNELSRGLDLAKKPALEIAEKPSSVQAPRPSPTWRNTTPPAILGADGRPADPTLQVPDSELKLPTDSKPRALEVKGAETDWPALQARWETYWKSLSHEQRRKLVPIPMLSASVQARLAIVGGHPHHLKPIDWMPLRRDAPESLREALKGMHWGRDQSALEFVDSQPTTDFEGRTAQMEKLLDLTHTRQSHDRPLEKAGYGSLHLNFSVPGRKLEAFAKTYNLLLLARLVKGGRTQDALAETSVAYSNELEMKGLITLWKGRLEVRVQTKSVRDEIEEMRRWLLLPEREAIGLMRAELRQGLTEAHLSEMAKYDPAAMYELIAEGAKGHQNPDWKVGDPRLAKLVIGHLGGSEDDAHILDGLLSGALGRPVRDSIAHEIAEHGLNRFLAERKVHPAFIETLSLESRRIAGGNREKEGEVREILRKYLIRQMDDHKPEEGWGKAMVTLAQKDPKAMAELVRRAADPDISSQQDFLIRFPNEAVAALEVKIAIRAALADQYVPRLTSPDSAVRSKTYERLRKIEARSPEVLQLAPLFERVIRENPKSAQEVVDYVISQSHLDPRAVTTLLSLYDYIGDEQVNKMVETELFASKHRDLLRLTENLGMLSLEQKNTLRRLRKNRVESPEKEAPCSKAVESLRLPH